MVSREESLPQPPAPPPFERRLRFGWTQIVGVSLLALLPIAATTGLLGTIERETSARSGALTIEARYPSTIHYKGSYTLVFDVRNDGEQALRDVHLRFEHAYLKGFGGLRFTPQASLLDGEHTTVSLGEIDAGTTRRVLLELQASDYGRSRGSVTAVSEGSGEARVHLGTLVLP